MFNELIEKVTITCPQCKTSIKINIPTNDGGFQKLQEQINKFVCPMCDADLSKIAYNVTDAIRTYNNSVRLLVTALDFANSTVE